MIIDHRNVEVLDAIRKSVVSDNVTMRDKKPSLRILQYCRFYLLHRI